MGSKPKAAPAATYTSRDGMSFKDPNKAADRDRQIALASALGYNSGGGNTLENWIAALAGPTSSTWSEYNDQGLTAADYRAEQRIKEQEAQVKEAEQMRKDAIAQGRQAVDTNLSSFNDGYFSNIGKSVLDYYVPQVDTQYQDANKQLTYKLARQGLLKSDAAGNERAKLKSDYDLQRANVTNRAADAEQQARENVSSAKSQMYNYAEASADPAAVDSRLASETARLRAYAPELTPLGQLFTDYISPIVQTVGSGLIAEQQGYKGFGTGLFGSSKGSAKYKTSGY